MTLLLLLINWAVILPALGPRTQRDHSDRWRHKVNLEPATAIAIGFKVEHHILGLKHLMMKLDHLDRKPCPAVRGIE